MWLEACSAIASESRRLEQYLLDHEAWRSRTRSSTGWQLTSEVDDGANEHAVRLRRVSEWVKCHSLALALLLSLLAAGSLGFWLGEAFTAARHPVPESVLASRGARRPAMSKGLKTATPVPLASKKTRPLPTSGESVRPPVSALPGVPRQGEEGLEVTGPRNAGGLRW